VKKADLHVHTYYSDGTFSPKEAVAEAKRSNLDAIAITDHDCTDGIGEAMEAARGCGLEVIPGVEITCEKNNTEIHMLGYFIDPTSIPLAELLKTLRASRIKRIHTMVERLKREGVEISPDAVFELASKGTVGRLHLATALYNKGLVSSTKEAFQRYIGDDAPCSVRRFNVSPQEAIGAILRSGGVPVYAHPKVMGHDEFIPEFMKAGLRGIEVFHTDHPNSTSHRYSTLAQKYGLLITGGSDCHGSGKGKKLMGGVTVPYSLVEELRREHRQILHEEGIGPGQ